VCYPAKTIRSVNPGLAGISAWVSAVGASVALNDLDGDGLPNYLCYVDTQTDQLIVAPVPGTPPRYSPFVLTPGPLPFDSNTMAPMGCLPLDANEDGLMDIVVYYWGRSTVVFLQRPASNMSAATFKPQELMPSVQVGIPTLRCPDLDGDGRIDLVLETYADGSRVLDARFCARLKCRFHVARLQRWQQSVSSLEERRRRLSSPSRVQRANERAGRSSSIRMDPSHGSM
jgi:hypothetical protein